MNKIESLRKFCPQNLVVVTLQYQVNVKRKHVIAASLYLPYDSLCTLTLFKSSGSERQIVMLNAQYIR